MFSKSVAPVLFMQKKGRLPKARNIFLLFRRAKAVQASAKVSDCNAKAYSEIPGPKGFLQIAKNIAEASKTIEQGPVWIEKKFARYGPIYKEHLGVFSFVHLCDTEAIEHLHRNDDKYPQRVATDAWLGWREQEKLAKGILIENDGPEWKRMRTKLDRLMMRPQHVATYADAFNDVITDFITRLRHIRAMEGNDVTVPNLDKELFHWSLETIGTVLYEKRLGGLANEKSQETTDFVRAVHNVFRTTEKLIMLPYGLAKYVAPTTYKEHSKAWRTIFNTGKKYIDERLEEIQSKLEKDEDIGGFLSTLLASQNLSQAEVYANITELMMAAVDTTSNAMQWAIYELSRNQDVQESLRHEIMSVTNGDVIHFSALQNMPYLKAVMKEVLRLYPIALVVTRILQEEIVLCGYNIPKGTIVIASTFATGRNPDIFKDPHSFKPERWLRSENKTDKPHAFAWLPFGFGSRMCIGRRVAELEMYLLTTRLLQNFRLIPLSDKPLTPISRSNLIPEKSVEVKLVDIP